MSNEITYVLYLRQVTRTQLTYVRSFTAVEPAHKWIIKFGRKIVEAATECNDPDEKTPYVLHLQCHRNITDDNTEDDRIIEGLLTCKANSICDPAPYMFVDEYTRLYAFTPDAYNALCDEHYNAFINVHVKHAFAENVINVGPYGNIEYGGCDASHFEKCALSRRDNSHSRMLEEFKLFLKTPKL